MKVIHLNHSDINGGAARATFRIHQALLKEKINSKIWANKIFSKDLKVEGPKNPFEKLYYDLGPRLIANSLVKTLKTKNPIIHSPSVLPSKWVSRINESDADIIHLHWVQGEMISISDIAKINKPTIWTPQDMWIFSGAEHYTDDNRWRLGYKKNNRPHYESGFDLNLWTWKRKMKFWSQSIQIVAPSQWLARCVRESVLTSEWPVSIIPNTINTDVWKPINKKIAREKLNLPNDVSLILFGAIGGGIDPRKGFDLLKDALKIAQKNFQLKKVELVIFGQDKPKVKQELGFPIHYMGKVDDDKILRTIYSSADVMLIPSRQDNLPNTGLEAHATGVPVIAFNTGGLSDIVDHKNNGYLADPFDVEDFANGIVWILENKNLDNLIKNARKSAVNKYSEKVIATQYIQLYKKLLA